MSDESSQDLLQVARLRTGYGSKEVLSGVSLTVAPKEVVAIIGHNGAGKSTLFKAIFGLLPIWDGNVAVDGRVVNKPHPAIMLKLGVAYVPQGGRIFRSLTVRENLELASFYSSGRQPGRERLESALALLPQLRAHVRQRAGSLSGGERQALSIAVALVAAPRLLLLDEPSLGLDPNTAEMILRFVGELKASLGTSVVVIEHRIRRTLEFADRVYVLRNGTVAFSGDSTSLRDEVRLHEVYL